MVIVISARIGRGWPTPSRLEKGKEEEEDEEVFVFAHKAYLY